MPFNNYKVSINWETQIAQKAKLLNHCHVGLFAQRMLGDLASNKN